MEALIVEAATNAMADAGVGPDDIDAIYLVISTTGLPIRIFRHRLSCRLMSGSAKPATRVENACATGSAAIYQGLNFLEAKQGKVVLVVSVEKMTRPPSADIGGILMKASYLKEDSEIEGSFASVFGQIAQQYYQKYGDQTDALAIAAKNPKNGVGNPWAQLRKDFGYEFCRDVSEEPDCRRSLKRTAVRWSQTARPQSLRIWKPR